VLLDQRQRNSNSRGLLPADPRLTIATISVTLLVTFAPSALQVIFVGALVASSGGCVVDVLAAACATVAQMNVDRCFVASVPLCMTTGSARLTVAMLPSNER